MVCSQCPSSIPEPEYDDVLAAHERLVDGKLRCRNSAQRSDVKRATRIRRGDMKVSRRAIAGHYIEFQDNPTFSALADHRPWKARIDAVSRPEHGTGPGIRFGCRRCVYHRFTRRRCATAHDDGCDGDRHGDAAIALSGQPRGSSRGRRDPRCFATGSNGLLNRTISPRRQCARCPVRRWQGRIYRMIAGS